MQQTLEFYNLPLPAFDCDCTLKLTECKLDVICEAYGIELKNHHDAAADAVACAKVYLKLLKGVKPDFSNVQSKPKKITGFSMPEGHERLCGNVLKPDLENADSTSSFMPRKLYLLVS